MRGDNRDSSPAASQIKDSLVTGEVLARRRRRMPL